MVVYYAGHGAPVVDPGAKSSDGMEKYLVPHDAHSDDLRSSAILMDDIQRFFGFLDANQVLFFIDSCYSGLAGGRTFDQPGFQRRGGLSDEFLEHLGNEGRFVVTACGPNEVSLETPELGHGLFTHYLLEGLKGSADADNDGRVSIDELYSYLYDNVSRSARQMGGSMKPIRKGSVSGTVYLSEYEPEGRKAAREASAQAADAFDRGDLDAAALRWQEALRLDPANQDAREGLDAVARHRAVEEEARGEAERRRLEELRRRHGTLLDHRLSGALSVQQLREAMEMLDRDPEGLAKRDRDVRTFVEHLADGEITPAQYARAIEVLTDPERRPLAEKPGATTEQRPETGRRSGTPVEQPSRTAVNAGAPDEPVGAPSPVRRRGAGTQRKPKHAAHAGEDAQPRSLVEASDSKTDQAGDRGGAERGVDSTWTAGKSAAAAPIDRPRSRLWWSGLLFAIWAFGIVLQLLGAVELVPLFHVVGVAALVSLWAASFSELDGSE